VIVGKTYYERGEPVKVLAAWVGESFHDSWGSPRPPSINLTLRIAKWPHDRPRRAPRNVIIQRKDGSLVVRPFRGLRTEKGGQAT
jgi:hypothetical protein